MESETTGPALAERDSLAERNFLAERHTAQRDCLAERDAASQRTLRLLSGLPLHVLTVLCLAAAWLIVAPRSPDLAAQAYRSYLFSHFGMLVWDENWYGGHHIPGYSLLYPPLASVLGLRLTGALAALASTVLFARIACASFGPRVRLAAIWFAVAAAGDLWIGRLTFALGVAFALAAVLCAQRRGSKAFASLAALCAALSAASSPVAGALLCLAALTDVLVNRRVRYALLLMAPVLLVVLPLQALFPEGGFEPYGLESFLPSTAVALAFVWALPAEQRLLRVGGWLFLLVNVLALLPTPLGSNVVRYAALLAGPLLLCAIAASGGFAGAGTSWAARESSGTGVARIAAWFSLPARRSPWALRIVLLGIACWVLWGPALQSSEVLSDPSTTAAYYQPLRRFLAQHVKGPVRIEVPFTRSHWETALLAPDVSLARGWERQLDKRYDEPIEANPLPAPVYRRWLDRNAVSYVALPDVPLDGSSVGEAALITRGAPFLREVFASRHWRVYEVLSSTPLTEGPGRLIALGHEGFQLRASAAGSFLVRVHYTPYWHVLAGRAKVSKARSGWTQVDVERRGTVSVQAQFSVRGAIAALEGL